MLYELYYHRHNGRWYLLKYFKRLNALILRVASFKTLLKFGPSKEKKFQIGTSQTQS